MQHLRLLHSLSRRGPPFPSSLAAIWLSRLPIVVYEETPLKINPKHLAFGSAEVHEPEAVGLPRGLLVHGVEGLLREHGAQLLNQGVQLQLVPQPEDRVEHDVDPHGGAHKPKLLGRHPTRDTEVPAADEERVEHAVPRLLVHGGVIRVVIEDHQNLVEFLEAQLLILRDALLVRDDLPERPLVPVLPPALLAVRVHAQLVPDVVLDGLPGGVDLHGGREDVDALKAAPVLLQNHRHEENGLPAGRGCAEDPVGGEFADHRIGRLLDGVVGRLEETHLAHSLPRARGSTRRAGF